MYPNDQYGPQYLSVNLFGLVLQVELVRYVQNFAYVANSQNDYEHHSYEKRELFLSMSATSFYPNNPSIIERIPKSNKTSLKANTSVSEFIFLFKNAPILAPIYAAGITGIV